MQPGPPGLDPSSTEVPMDIEAETLVFLGLVGASRWVSENESPFLLSGFQSSVHGAGDEHHGLAGEDAGTP